MRIGVRIVGVLALDHGVVAHQYTAQELALARAVAQLAGMALERDRLVRERTQAHTNVLALQEANRRMSEFLSLAAHELRTPLTTVIGNVELAQRRLAEQTRAEDAASIWSVARLQPVLTRAHGQLGRINRLVDDLLDAARVQADRLEIRLEPCEPVAMVSDVVEEQRQLHPDRLITFDAPPGEPVRLIRVDRDRIVQVITNYLSNALRYSAADRPVAVGVACGDRELRVSVRDEGPGIPSTELTRIWERFQRGAGAQKQAGSHVGLGLGLYISRTIIERHGGRVGVDSVPGAGSTFWFTLPLEPAPGA
jgi:signal transduction histidine kinase